MDHSRRNKFETIFCHNIHVFWWLELKEEHFNSLNPTGYVFSMCKTYAIPYVLLRTTDTSDVRYWPEIDHPKYELVWVSTSKKPWLLSFPSPHTILNTIITPPSDPHLCVHNITSHLLRHHHLRHYHSPSPDVSSLCWSLIYFSIDGPF